VKFIIIIFLLYSQACSQSNEEQRYIYKNDNFIFNVSVNKLFYDKNDVLTLTFEITSLMDDLKIFNTLENLQFGYNKKGRKLIIDWGGDYSANIETEAEMISLKKNEAYSVKKEITIKHLIKEFNEKYLTLVLDFGFFNDKNGFFNKKTSKEGLTISSYTSEVIEKKLKSFSNVLMGITLKF
jgi:hypothetical protein